MFLEPTAGAAGVALRKQRWSGAKPAGGYLAGAFNITPVLCEGAASQARHERAATAHNAALCYLPTPLSPLEGGTGVISLVTVRRVLACLLQGVNCGVLRA